MRVYGATTVSVGDTSNGNFSIVGAAPTASVTVTSPTAARVDGGQHGDGELDEQRAVGKREGRAEPQLSRGHVGADYGQHGGDGAVLRGIRSSTPHARLRVTSNVNPAVGDTSDGDFMITAREFVREALLPLTTALSAAAPNPFNPTTNFTYQLAEAGYVRLEVFDDRALVARLIR